MTGIEHEFCMCWLRQLQVWNTPLSNHPLEPCLAAAFHGIEICLLLMAEFVRDERRLELFRL